MLAQNKKNVIRLIRNNDPLFHAVHDFIFYVTDRLPMAQSSFSKIIQWDIYESPQL